MKRDMELVRTLLFKIEASNRAPRLSEIAARDDKAAYTAADYHLRMLQEAGFIRGLAHASGAEWVNLELTWSGHEFLDILRDQTIWEKTKAGATKLGVVGLDLLLGIAKEYAKAEIKNRLGLSL
jgi:hypothetical protein